MHQPRRLLLDRRHHVRVAVAGVADRDAGQEVEVLVALGVDQHAARAGRELDREAGVGVGQRAHSGGPDLRALAGVGEQLEQHRVRHPPVDDVREADTPPWMASRHACSFGRIPPPVPSSAASTSSAPVSEITDAGSDGSRSQPGDVGEEHQLVGAERARHRGGRLVGVDVVRAPVAVGADRRDDRDVVRGDVLDHADVDSLDPPDEADVLAARALHRVDPEQQPVVAAQPDRRLPVAVDAQHDVLVDLADEHHLGHLDGRLVAHPQAADELDRQVEPLHVAR